MKIALLVLCVYTLSMGSIYSIYTNHRAMREGDILTVLIVENAKAGTSTTTKTSKSSNFNVGSEGGSGLLRFMPSFSADGGMGNAYAGAGDTHREGKFTATLSARVEEVFDNGNLLIRGDRVVKINDEEEIIRISGIVRPQDIRGNNEIYSSNIAQAEIVYSGKGVNNDAQRPGPITRFFNRIF